MNCPECQDLLNRRLDGEVPANAAELDGHLAECAACREQHQAATRFVDALRARALPAPPKMMSGRLVAAVLHDQRRRGQRRWWTGLAVAASIMLMIVGGYIWWSSGDLSQTGNPIVQEKDKGKPIEPADPSFAQSFDDARRAVGSLTNRLAETTREQAKLLLAANPLDLTLPTLDPLEANLNPAVAPLRQTGQGVSEGVQTVARSAQRTVSYFVREIARWTRGGRN